MATGVARSARLHATDGACIFRLVRYIGGALPAAAGASAAREVSAEFAPGHETAFADGFPILLATEVRPGSPNTLEPPIPRFKVEA